MTRRLLRQTIVAALLALAAACASGRPAPSGGTLKYAGYPTPVIPATLRPAASVRARHDDAWQRLQSGDLRGATRDYTAVLKQSPDFYPSETGLGFVSLANGQFKAAASHFSAATSRNDRYLPAWIGQAEAQIGLNDDGEAITAMERVLVLDPSRQEVRGRLEIVRARQVQTLLETGRRARLAGKTADARSALGRAAQLSPSSAVVFVELARADVAARDLDDAETHAQRAVDLDPGDAEAQVLLADICEARGRYGAAAAALARAIAIDPRPEWRARLPPLRDKAELAALPADFREIEHASVVTRGQVAAFIGIKLNALIDRAPKRAVVVATDVRTHWASAWILRVTQAGVMDVLPNHTFQPSAQVRRSDLSRVVAQLVNLAGTARSAELARWKASRPRFVDVPPTHAAYRAAALSVAAGAMTADGGRFDPTGDASGEDLSRAVARIAQISSATR